MFWGLSLWGRFTLTKHLFLCICDRYQRRESPRAYEGRSPRNPLRISISAINRRGRICGLAAAEIFFSLCLGNAHYEVFHFPPDLRHRALMQRNFVNLSLFWSGRQFVGILLEIIEFLWAWKGSAGNLAELPNQHIVETAAATLLVLSTVLLPLGDFFLRHFAPFLPSVNTFLAFVGIWKPGTSALVCRVTAMRPRWAFLRISTVINIVGAGKNRLPISWIVSLLQLYQFVKKLWLFGLKVCYQYVDLRHPWTFKTRTNFA